MRQPGDPVRHSRDAVRVGSGSGRMVTLTMLVVLGTILHVVETLFLPPLVIPGAKLGLANIVTVLTLCLFGPLCAVVVAVLRVVAGSLLSATFGSVGFLLALSGALMSTAAMSVLRRTLAERVSTVGLSLAGAVAHNVTQLVVAILVVENVGLAAVLPYLLVAAAITGYLVGLVSHLTLRYLRRALDTSGHPR